MPNSGCESECFTLYNSLHNRELKIIDHNKLENIVEQTSKLGPQAELPPWIDQNVKFKDLVEAIVSVSSTLNEVAGPGYPFCLLGNSKEDVLSKYGHFVYSCVIEKFLLLGNYDFTGLNDPILMYQLGLVNPLKTFTKNEAHKKTKLASPGPRLIVNPAMDDEILSKLINCYLKEQSMDSWGLDQASCLGMGRTPEDNQRMCNIVNFAFSTGKRLATNDCKAFEHSVQKEFNDAESEVTIGRYRCKQHRFASNLIRNLRHLERTALYITSSGKVIAKNRNHGTASGSDITSQGNTNKREILCAYVVGPNAWSRENGDDNIEEFTENAVEKYAQIGITIKDYLEITPETPFEFCSAFYHRGKIKPINIVKSFFHLLRSPRNELELGTFLNDYKDHEKYEKCYQTLRAIGWIA